MLVEITQNVKLGEITMHGVGVRSSQQVAQSLCINIFNNELIIIQQIERMSHHEEEDHPHKKYSKISLKKRQLLIDLVIGKSDSLTKTSKKLNIKLSTAKLILRKYRKTGVLFNKNMNSKAIKTEKIENQPMKSVLSSLQIKNQQNQYGDGSIKQEPHKDEHLPQGMIIPSVYYPVYQGNWFAYPWYSYPFYL